MSKLSRKIKQFNYFYLLTKYKQIFFCNFSMITALDTFIEWIKFILLYLNNLQSSCFVDCANKSLNFTSVDVMQFVILLTKLAPTIATILLY
jgi:hypothetical protein